MRLLVPYSKSSKVPMYHVLLHLFAMAELWKPSTAIALTNATGLLRKKYGATVEAALELAGKLSALPPGAAVEAQNIMHRITMVRCYNAS